MIKIGQHSTFGALFATETFEQPPADLTQCKVFICASLAGNEISTFERDADVAVDGDQLSWTAPLSASDTAIIGKYDVCRKLITPNGSVHSKPYPCTFEIERCC